MKLSLAEAVAAVNQGRHLSAEQSAEAFGVVMRGEAPHEELKALLLGLKQKGEHADEVAGAAQALRAAMIRLPVASHGAQVSGSRPATIDPRRLVDTCGTGGGTVTTFNISTTAAFVVAGAGIPVAKHGNRSFTSRSGSADVLEALGVDITQAPEQAADTLAKVGLAFLFAPTYHPAMRHAGAVRKELRTNTIFNLIGPLANPAGARRQVIGVSDRDRATLIADAVGRLGCDHVLVVYAEVGMDEVSPVGITRVWEIGGPRGSGPKPQTWELDPADYGLGAKDLGALGGGEPAENAERLERLLIDPHLDPVGAAAVLLNAAAAIYVSGAVDRFVDAVARARESLESGKAAGVLERLRG